MIPPDEGQLGLCTIVAIISPDPSLRRDDLRWVCMSSSTNDKFKGNLHEAKGKIKEETGSGKRMEEPTGFHDGFAASKASRITRNLALPTSASNS